jgi:hypothetical protein
LHKPSRDVVYYSATNTPLTVIGFAFIPVTFYDPVRHIQSTHTLKFQVSPTLPLPIYFGIDGLRGIISGIDLETLTPIYSPRLRADDSSFDATFSSTAAATHAPSSRSIAPITQIASPIVEVSPLVATVKK